MKKTILEEDNGLSSAFGMTPINVDLMVSQTYYSGQKGNNEDLGRAVSSRTRWA